MSLNKISPLRAYALGFRRSRKIFAKLIAAMNDAEKIRMRAVLTELDNVQAEIAELADDYQTIKEVTEAMVERFEHPEH